MPRLFFGADGGIRGTLLLLNPIHTA